MYQTVTFNPNSENTIDQVCIWSAPPGTPGRKLLVVGYDNYLEKWVISQEHNPVIFLKDEPSCT